jgi:hypothetical protein
MTRTASKTSKTFDGLERAIADLAYPTVPLTLSGLDSLAERAQSSGSVDLCGQLILTVHGRGALGEARKLAERFLLHFPGDPDLVKIRGLVAPPRIITRENLPNIDRRTDLQWIKANSADYPGDWLVLSGGVLLGHHPRLSEAQDQARAAGLTERPLLHQVPPY